SGQISAMFNRSQLQGMILLCASFLASFSAQGETAWVSDQFEITLRTGPSSDNAIQLVIDSGTQLDVLEIDADSGYSRVMTMGGTDGWVLSRYLMAEPTAREQLETLTQQLTNVDPEGASMDSQLDAIRAAHDAATRQISVLENEKSVLLAEVDEIRRVSANALAITSQNKGLQQQLIDAEIRLSLIEQENANLGSETTRNWFVTGALVLFGGVLVGLILPRMKWQRKSRYDQF
ncbi:MAG: TIGR04211 family SH3 domain-containing protein, partial [Proteobacteria bacterium]|nr:TIGR04211 family SH3 domain-containing protein [Pseudomonadota bacterium]